MTVSGAPDSIFMLATTALPIYAGDTVTLVLAHSDLGNFSGMRIWIDVAYDYSVPNPVPGPRPCRGRCGVVDLIYRRRTRRAVREKAIHASRLSVERRPCSMRVGVGR